MTWVIGNFRSSLSLFIGLALDCEINEHWIVCSCTCITLFFLFSRSQSENQVRRGQTGRGADDREKTSSSATMQRAMPFTDGLAQSETKRTLGAPPRIDELGRILGERGAHRKAKGSVRAHTQRRDTGNSPGSDLDGLCFVHHRSCAHGAFAHSLSLFLLF